MAKQGERLDAGFDADREATSPEQGVTIGDVVAERLSRRDLMRGALAGSVLAAALPPGFMSASGTAMPSRASTSRRGAPTSQPTARAARAATTTPTGAGKS